MLRTAMDIPSGSPIPYIGWTKLVVQGVISSPANPRCGYQVKYEVEMAIGSKISILLLMMRPFFDSLWNIHLPELFGFASLSPIRSIE